MANNKVYFAKRNTGSKDNLKWEFYGTVVIRQSGNGGVLYIRTGEVDANNQPVSLEIALFAKRDKPAEGRVAGASA